MGRVRTPALPASAALPYSPNSYLLTPNSSPHRRAAAIPGPQASRLPCRQDVGGPRGQDAHTCGGLNPPANINVGGPRELDAHTTNYARAVLPYSPNSYLLTPDSSSPRQRRAAFTLLEMLVALTVLVILMAAMGEIFSIAGRTVRVGQATLIAMSSVRSAESQIAHDISHLDTNGFLIIRQRYYAPAWTSGVNYQPGDEVSSGGSYWVCQQANNGTTAPSAPNWMALTGTGYPIWRADQISFLETGDFHGHTGGTVSSGAGNENNTAGLSDYLTANKALVWFGQLVASYGTSGNNATMQPDYPQSTLIPAGTPPSGETSGQFYFGREAMLLIPQGTPNLFGSSVYTYPVLSTSSSGTASDGSAAVTSSRLDAAYDTIPGAVGTTESYVGSLPNTPIASLTASLSTIANDFCYRFATLIAPGASEISAGTSAQALNGYFRMTPIMLQGVPSFAVDWTDGAQITATGQLVWYGLDGTPNGTATTPAESYLPLYSAAAGSTSLPNPIAVAGTNSGDVAYVFYAGNRQYWPKAIKITYEITDPANRMEGGKWITQVVNLPQ